MSRRGRQGLTRDRRRPPCNQRLDTASLISTLFAVFRRTCRHYRLLMSKEVVCRDLEPDGPVYEGPSLARRVSLETFFEVRIFQPGQPLLQYVRHSRIREFNVETDKANPRERLPEVFRVHLIDGFR